MNHFINLWAFIAPITLSLTDDAGGGTGGQGGDTLLSGGDAAGAGAAAAATDDAAPAYSVMNVYKDGGIDPNATAAFGEDKELTSFFSKYQGAEKPNEAVLAGIKNLQYLAGQKGLEILPDDAPDSVKAERHEQMRKLNGTPDTPADYGVVKPEGMPDAQWNQEYVTDIMTVLHKHNASPAMVEELMAMDGTHAAKLAGEGEAATVAGFKAQSDIMAAEFGTKSPERIDHATRMARTLGLDPEKDPMFKSATVVIAFAKMADMVSEDRMVSGAGDNHMGGQSDREKARDVVFNKSNPQNAAYHNTEDPRHKEATDFVEALNKRHAAKLKAGT